MVTRCAPVSRLAGVPSSVGAASRLAETGKINVTVLPPVDRDKLYTELSYTQSGPGLQAGTYTLLLRVINPLPNGKALKFANQKQDQALAGWLTLGTFAVR